MEDIFIHGFLINFFRKHIICDFLNYLLVAFSFEPTHTMTYGVGGWGGGVGGGGVGGGGLLLFPFLY